MIHFVNKKMPGGLPKKTARALLDIEDRHYVPIIRDPARTSSESEAVFYFPGCGSERLFSQVGLATQAMLWHVGVQTVLPPGYLCCGYPQRGAGQFDKAEKIITDNRVLFHRVANTLNYLDIKTVVVSCGTCYDQLQGYKFDEIFPGCRIIDIHEYLMERGVQLAGVTGVRYMYHDPCHSPMKGHDPLKVVNALLNDKLNGRVEKNDRCCGESGTFAMTRPDVATQVRFRKEQEMRAGAARLRADGFKGEVKVLTSCPSCLQGLKRYNDDADLDADYIVVEIARHVLGPTGCRSTCARRTTAGSSACWSEEEQEAVAIAVMKVELDVSGCIWWSCLVAAQWRWRPRRRSGRHRALRAGAGRDAGQRAAGLAQAEAHPGRRLHSRCRAGAAVRRARASSSSSRIRPRSPSRLPTSTR